MISIEKQAELQTRIKNFRNKNSSHFHPVKPFNIKGLLQGLVFFLPLIYVIIYTIGFMKYLGHLDAYELDPVEFPIPVDTVLLWGVLALIPGLKYWLMLPALLTAYLALIMLALFANKPRQRIVHWSMKFISKIPKPRKPANGDLASVKGMVSQADSSITLTIQLFFCFLIVFIPILIGYVSMNQGVSEAKQHQQEFLSSKKHNIYISTELTGNPYMRVTCNTTHCAFWNKKGTQLLRHDQVQKTLLIDDDEEDNKSSQPEKSN